MPLCSLVGLRRELFSSNYTRYDTTHPTVEAIPVLYDKRSKNLYNRTARGVGGDWIQLKDEFCLFFYRISKVIAHRNQLMTFEQGDESLGVAWARYMHLIESGPPHQIPEEILMQHFIYGLKPESTHFLNVSSEGSVMYNIVAEARTLSKRS